MYVQEQDLDSSVCTSRNKTWIVLYTYVQEQDLDSSVCMSKNKTWIVLYVCPGTRPGIEHQLLRYQIPMRFLK